jgi:hypothetical protein
MFTELQLLKTYVDQLLSDPATYNSNTISQVTAECTRLQAFLFDVFNKSKDVKGLSDILNWYQNSFIKLADALFYSSDISRILATQALILIIGLTRHTQEQYKDLLDGKQPLPIFEASELSQKVDAELIVIQKGLHEKHISIPLIEQVVKAHTDLFKPTKYPALCYSEREYVEIFLPQLKALADDNREKGWNGRIRQLLIKYNFNHMGVYKFLAIPPIPLKDFIGRFER